VQRKGDALRKNVCAVLALLLYGAGTPVVAQSPARAAFTRGVAALHAFEYEDANEAFQQARKADPTLALAYWGEAMSWHQTLWGHENVAEGRVHPAFRRQRDLRLAARFDEALAVLIEIQLRHAVVVGEKEIRVSGAGESR